MEDTIRSVIDHLFEGELAKQRAEQEQRTNTAGNKNDARDSE